MKKLALLTAVALFAITAPAQAAIVVDQSPDVNGLTTGFTASNIATGQNFLLQFTLGSATSLSGAAIYSAFGSANVGDGAVFIMWSDAAGAPGGPIVSLLTALDAIDASGSSADPSLRRLHASFASTALGAGT